MPVYRWVSVCERCQNTLWNLQHFFPSRCSVTAVLSDTWEKEYNSALGCNPSLNNPSMTLCIDRLTNSLLTLAEKVSVASAGWLHFIDQECFKRTNMFIIFDPPENQTVLLVPIHIWTWKPCSLHLHFLSISNMHGKQHRGRFCKPLWRFFLPCLPFLTLLTAGSALTIIMKANIINTHAKSKVTLNSLALLCLLRCRNVSTYAFLRQRFLLVLPLWRLPWRRDRR